MRSITLSPFMLLLLLLLLPACTAIPRSFVRSDHAELPAIDVEGSPMFRVLPANAIPALDHPEFTSVAEAMGVHEPGEPVIVVAMGDEVRVYSTWMLSAHEVVNDVLGGTPLAVTY